MINYDPFERPDNLSKEDKEILLKIFNDALVNPLAQLKKRDGSPLGKILVMGTGGSEAGTISNFEEMFYNPEFYNIINYQKPNNLDYYKSFQDRITPEDFDNIKHPFKS